MKRKKDKCNILLRFLLHLCVIADIGEDIFSAGQAEIPYFVCSLTLRAYLEILINLFQGAYHSVARALRWLYETNLAGAVACIDPSLLDKEYYEKKDEVKGIRRMVNPL